MTVKRTVFLTLGMAAALLVVVGAAPAGALPSCNDCDCDSPCDELCWDPGLGGWSFCDEFLCEDYPICCNTINGTTGDDLIYGTSDRDCIYGLSGGDTLHGGDGDDDLFGGSGDDTLYGEADDDYCHGGSGHDTCTCDYEVSCDD